ncbi:MAG: S-layer homology domain-containing protein [Clostridia bacterium]|nr:S-layer homology domain-containing protein [Clostridia bacterium]
MKWQSQGEFKHIKDFIKSYYDDRNFQPIYDIVGSGGIKCTALPYEKSPGAMSSQMLTTKNKVSLDDLEVKLSFDSFQMDHLVSLSSGIQLLWCTEPIGGEVDGYYSDYYAFCSGQEQAFGIGWDGLRDAMPAGSKGLSINICCGKDDHTHDLTCVASCIQITYYDGSEEWSRYHGLDDGHVGKRWTFTQRSGDIINQPAESVDFSNGLTITISRDETLGYKVSLTDGNGVKHDYYDKYKAAYFPVCRINSGLYDHIQQEMDLTGLVGLEGYLSVGTCASGRFDDNVFTLDSINGQSALEFNGCPHVPDGNTVIEQPYPCQDGISYETCTVCGGVCNVKHMPLTADHDWSDWTVTINPSCTTNGARKRQCGVCGIIEREKIPKTGHDYNGVVTAPTCTDRGYTTFTCANCGDTYIGDYKEALGHDYIAGETVGATCTEKGYTVYTCSRCKDEYFGDYTDTVDHQVDEWTDEKSPTCTENGSRTGICAVCGGTVTEEIPAPGHTPGEWETVKEPTYDEKGRKERKCTVCGELIESDEIPMLEWPFSDVPKGEWYTEAALYCYENGFMYMTYVETKNFSPDMELTRAQMVQILAQVAKADLDHDAESVTFKDVPSGEWYTAAVEWAYSLGLTAGMGDGYFSPETKVTREQLAVFLRAYARMIGRDISASADIEDYADKDDVSLWALEAIRWAIAEDMIHGVSQTAISPRSYATRAQTAVIIKAVTENVINNTKGLLEKYGLSVSVSAHQTITPIIEPDYLSKVPGMIHTALIEISVKPNESNKDGIPGNMSLKVGAEGKMFKFDGVYAKNNGNGEFSVIVEDKYIKPEFDTGIVLFEDNEIIKTALTFIIGSESETVYLDATAIVNK